MNSEKSKVRSEKRELTARDLALFGECAVKLDWDGSIYWVIAPQFHSNHVQLAFEKGRRALNDFESIDEVKPILRPLSDMTVKEFKEVFKAHNATETYAVEKIAKMSSTRYDLLSYLAYMDRGNAIPEMLSRYFDLFSWIDADLAIDATELTPNPYQS